MTKQEKTVWGYMKRAIRKADDTLSKPYDIDRANDTRELLGLVEMFIEDVERKKAA